MLSSELERFVAEDLGEWDDSSCLVPEIEAKAAIIAREDCIVSGLSEAQEILNYFGLKSDLLYADGEFVPAGSRVIFITGSARAILQSERLTLNFLARMSGISTLTRQCVLSAGGVRIAATRKTTPGLRILEKYAVRVGGGINHRTGLYDGVLIKENHIAAAGGIAEAISRARAYIPHTMKIEVETETLTEVAEALSAAADIIMLDNMDLAVMREAVALIDGRALVEASGGVNLETIRGIAETGVDIISVGALTHSARAMDISMLLEGC